MDTSGGDEDAGDAPDEEELLKSADSLLGSPSSHKEIVVKKTVLRPLSVSSLVSDMSLNANKSVELIPGDPTIKNDDASARIQSDPDLKIKKKPVMVTTGTETDPDPGSAPGKPSKQTNTAGGAPVGFGAGDGAGAGTGTGAAVGVGTGTDTGTLAGNLKTSAEGHLQNKKRFRDSISEPIRRADSAFPPDYLNVRRAREKSNPCVELPTPDGNRRKEAVCVRPRPGYDLNNDDRQYKVNNYHVPSLKKNYSSSVKRRDDGIYCVSCDEEHDFNDNNPIVVFITDQNFPPPSPRLSTGVLLSLDWRIAC
jgi:hypothetical protein